MRFLLLLPVCGFAAAACAQTTELPLGSPAYHIIDRLEIKSGEDAPFFSGQKPYTRTSVEQYALRLDSARLLDITGKDRQDLFYLHKDNNLSLAARTEDCPRKDRYVESKRPFLNTFYRTPANFYEANVPHFAFNINPILNLSIGSELGASRIDFNNTRGVNIQAGIDNKVWLWTNLTDNQTRFEGFVTRDIREKRYVPGAGYYKVYNSKVLARGVTDAYDYLNADGGVAVQATQHIKVQLGHGRNFIGEGYRSLFLSDISNNYFYLKLNTRVWKFDYQNIFAELTRDNGGRGLDTLYGKKYMATHHLSFRPTKNLTIGAFETVVFSRPDHFEFQYLNPVIFYRTIESSLGSPDNSLLGFDIIQFVAPRFALRASAAR